MGDFATVWAFGGMRASPEYEVCGIGENDYICGMNGRKVKYPIGNQDFAGLIEDGYVYVDKTDLVYDLVENNKYVFLARPRRFGKSLLLSTIRYYLEGRKDLFEGLKIMTLERVWKKRPVLHLALSGHNPKESDSLKELINLQFRQWEEKYSVETPAATLSARFTEIIISAFRQTGQKMGILIDEYDNPLINALDNPEVLDTNRSLLKSIYSTLKDLDEYIDFAMFTGVSRFSNTSIFSGLNNLYDISFDEEYESICGFTQDEITRYLREGLEDFASKHDIEFTEVLSRLKEEYDGYHFSERLLDIYNPFSVLNCLRKKKIENYWVQTGPPEFLIKKLNRESISFTGLFSAEGNPMTLASIDVAFDSPVALFYQTGYLTIKSYDRETGLFQLGIPNREVNQGLFNLLLKRYSFRDEIDGMKNLRLLSNSLNRGEAEEFVKQLRVFLSPIAYHLQGKISEIDFERTLFVIFHIMGFHVHTEIATSYGRIDLLVETQQYVYIVELKYGGSGEEAWRQIREKEYSLPWKYDGRKIYEIGIGFSPSQRNISTWKITWREEA